MRYHLLPKSQGGYIKSYRFPPAQLARHDDAGKISFSIRHITFQPSSLSRQPTSLYSPSGSRNLNTTTHQTMSSGSSSPSDEMLRYRGKHRASVDEMAHERETKRISQSNTTALLLS